MCTHVCVCVSVSVSVSLCVCVFMLGLVFMQGDKLHHTHVLATVGTLAVTFRMLPKSRC